VSAGAGAACAGRSTGPATATVPDRMMNDDTAQTDRLDARFGAALQDLAQRALVTERLVDKDLYRVLVTTTWVNLVLDPDAVGLDPAALEPMHDLINRYIAEVMGEQETLTSCFRYLNSKAGEQAMRDARLTEQHRDLLLYFASIILDPEGHRRWMAEISDQPAR